ncbi:hypothetical protein H2200_008209 [Cladophialophora chaetospira]|uniref:NAD(P)-binding domain-containing protein n=1 Tax=Cladophialophora chaetospira TaxID=386627 RepID=A0AA39CG77_9EURO|nr:hypothetical protein H2200_008209 [Cladophialophora chaetospira]
MVKVFLTGASGLVGGEALHQIASQPSEHQMSCLVRDAEKGSIIKKAYPDVRIVEGDLDSIDIIRKEAKDADVVFHLASTNHLPSATAILEGISDKSRSTPGYWIQISGGTLVAGDEIAAGRYGEAPEKSYNDLTDTEEIRAVVKKNAGRAVDNLVIAQSPEKAHVALIAGPIIHGEGRGPVNRRSIQAPEITRLTLQRGKAPVIGKGLNVWSAVHIHDLGKLFALLLDAAVSKNNNVWNENGLYFPENERLSFGGIGRAIAAEAHKQKFTPSADVETITAEKANSPSGHAAVIWGTNANLTGSRAKEQLGWKPTGPTFMSGVSDLVRSEAKRLGISPAT